MAETEASRLLAHSSDSASELRPWQQILLAEVRTWVPFIREGDFIRHIDAYALAHWYRQQVDDALAEGHAQVQASAVIGSTLDQLFPSERGDHAALEERLQRIGQAQAARGETPRLQIIGVGGEGAVFVDVGDRGVYKIHPGGAEDAATGVGRVQPGRKWPTRVEIFRVPLTETLRRYCRQSILGISSPTEIKGVTENGRLVTRQPMLDADHATTGEEIAHLMASAGGVRIQIDSDRKELRHCYMMPDQKGNWMLVVDLKPANVLRDKPTTTPLLTDGIIAPITPEIFSSNPQLAGYQPGKPEEQF